MKFRFYLSLEHLKRNNLRMLGYFVENDSHELLASADLDGSHFFIVDETISHKDLQNSVSHITSQCTVGTSLPTGHYSGEGWEAELSELKPGVTRVKIRVTGYSLEKIKNLYRQLVTGQLLPTFVVKGTQLTSEQVAAIVYGNGDREHWLHVVQSAQDTILKSADAVRNLQEQVANLNRQLAILKPA